MIPGFNKSEKPINVTGIDKIQLKFDCINGSVLDKVRQPILFNFALDKLLCHNIYKEPRIKLSKKINKPVLSHITFCQEEDNHKPVNFNNETISFICQLIKKNK